MWRLLISIPLLAASLLPARSDELVDRGRELLTTHCANCHGMGQTGASRHPGAPSFRSIGERFDLDTIDQTLRAGLSSTHRDMPSFRFTRNDARAVRAYLRAIQE